MLQKLKDTLNNDVQYTAKYKKYNDLREGKLHPYHIPRPHSSNLSLKASFHKKNQTMELGNISNSNTPSMTVNNSMANLPTQYRQTNQQYNINYGYQATLHQEKRRLTRPLSGIVNKSTLASNQLNDSSDVYECTLQKLAYEDTYKLQDSFSIKHYQSSKNSRNGKRVGPMNKRQSYSEVVSQVNRFHPTHKAKNFDDLSNHDNYLNVLNETIQKVDDHDINENKEIEVAVNSLHTFHVEKHKYILFSVKVLDQKSPMKMFVRLKGKYHINYAIYHSFNIKDCGFKKGYDKKYMNTKYELIESKDKISFKETTIFFSLFSDAIGELDLFFKFPPDPKKSKNKDAVIDPTQPNKLSVLNDPSAVFKIADKQFFGNMQPSEKRQEIKRIKMGVYFRRADCLNFVNKNMVEAWDINEQKQQNIAENNENYMIKLSKAKEDKKVFHDQKLHALFYKMERNEIRREQVKLQLKAYESKYLLHWAQKQWIIFLNFGLFMNFFKQQHTKLNNQYSEFVWHLIASNHVIKSYKSHICSKWKTPDQRIHRDSLLTLNLLISNIKKKTRLYAIHVVGNFIGEYKKKSLLKHMFYLKACIIKKYMEKMLNFRKNIKSFKTELRHRIPIVQKQMNKEHTGTLPKKIDPGIEIELIRAILEKKRNVFF